MLLVVLNAWVTATKDTAWPSNSSISLAKSASERVRRSTSELPDVPTIAETGLPGYEYIAWFGAFAPGTTRPELVARISALVREAVDSPDTRDRLRNQGVETQIQSPDEFRAKVRAEIERWAPVIEKSGIKGSL
jgi:tripartite-type tricarboxylate transporter receptor subunit TctC